MPQAEHAATHSEASIEARDLLLVLLASIKDPQGQLVFTLHELVGLPVSDIAVTLNIPEGTATTRLRRARLDIAEAMKRIEAQDRRHEGAAVIPLFGALHLGMEMEGPMPPLPEGMADRVWARLQHLPELPHGHDGGDGDGGSSGDSGDTAAQGAKMLARKAGLLLGGLGLGLGLGVLWEPLHHDPEPVEARPDTVAMATPSEAPTAPSSAAPSAPASPSPRSASASPPESDGAERALMAHASRKLAKGDTGAALAMGQDHARGVGADHLAEEWEALGISALLRAGRVGEARERLDGFAHRYPASGRIDGFREALPSAR